MQEKEKERLPHIQTEEDHYDIQTTSRTFNNTPLPNSRFSSKHVRTMAMRMRRRAGVSLILMVAAIAFDFGVRMSYASYTMDEVTEAVELLLLCLLVGFGVYALVMRFKTYLLFFILMSVAFGLLAGLMQALVEAQNMNYPVDPLNEKYVALRGFANIGLSLSCFVAGVSFYFYRDALIMWDFNKSRDGRGLAR